MSHSGPRLLVTDKASAIFLERARVLVENDRVVFYNVEDSMVREYNIPHVNTAVLFLGQGTSITQEAMRLLGEEHVHVVVSGSGGTPMHMGSLTSYTHTDHFRKMVPIWQEPELSLIAAKIVMHHRADFVASVGCDLTRRYIKVRDTGGLERICSEFQTKNASATDIQQLLGFEGNFSKACYAEFSKMSGIEDFRRDAGAGVVDKTERDKIRVANSLIDHGNYLCYGMAGAALWALGIPPHMSVFHGKTRPGGLVFDIADGFKDAVVLPIAFGTQAKDDFANTFRARMIDTFDNLRVLQIAIEIVEGMISKTSKE